jgi:hypothetical protein
MSDHMHPYLDPEKAREMFALPVASGQIGPEPPIDPVGEEERELAARYNADVQRLRRLRAEAYKIGEIVATLRVNFGPNGRILPDVLPDSGLSPMQMLMEVLFALSVKAGVAQEQVKLSMGVTGWLTPPTWENHVVDVAPGALFTDERLQEMGLRHVCDLQAGYQRYKRCKYTTRERFDAVEELLVEKRTGKELREGPRRPVLDTFLQAKLAEYEGLKLKAVDRKQDRARLDQFFFNVATTKALF